MKLTIIKETNTVVIDNVGYVVDCSALPARFHALQWNGTTGEVEYKPTTCDHCGVRSKKGNEFIKELGAYAAYVDAWGVAKEQAEAFAAQEAQKAMADAPRPEG